LSVFSLPEEPENRQERSYYLVCILLLEEPEVFRKHPLTLYMYSPPGRASKSLANILLVLILLQEEPENLQERSSYLVCFLFTTRA
jgi:hypothetical protein